MEIEINKYYSIKKDPSNIIVIVRSEYVDDDGNQKLSKGERTYWATMKGALTFIQRHSSANSGAVSLDDYISKMQAITDELVAKINQLPAQ